MGIWPIYSKPKVIIWFRKLLKKIAYLRETLKGLLCQQKETKKIKGSFHLPSPLVLLCTTSPPYSPDSGKIVSYACESRTVIRRIRNGVPGNEEPWLCKYGHKKLHVYVSFREASGHWKILCKYLRAAGTPHLTPSYCDFISSNSTSIAIWPLLSPTFQEKVRSWANFLIQWKSGSEDLPSSFQYNFLQHTLIFFLPFSKGTSITLFKISFWNSKMLTAYWVSNNLRQS